MVELVERNPSKNILLTTTLALSGYGVGYYISIMNSMGNPLLVGVYNLDEDARISAFGNLNFLFAIGAMIGVLSAGKIMNTFGRRRTVTYIDLVAFFIIMLHAVQNLYVLFFTRLAMGFISCVYGVPASIMMVECLPRKLSSVGNIISYSVVTFTLLMTFVQQLIFSQATLIEYWRFFLCYPAVIALIRFSLLYMFLDFESPNWLLQTHSADTSVKTILANSYRTIYHDQGIEEKVEELVNQCKESNSEKPVEFKMLLEQRFRVPMISSLIVMIGQQLTGINFLVFFSTELFDKISGNGKTISFVFGLGNLLGSFVCMYFVNKYSRLFLLKNGTIVQGVSLLLIVVGVQMGYYFILPISVMAYILSFAVGMGATAGLYINEILPPTGVGFTLATNWVSAALVGKLCPIGTQLIGSNGMLLFFSLWCFAICYLMDKYCIDVSTSRPSIQKDLKMRELEAKLVPTD